MKTFVAAAMLFCFVTGIVGAQICGPNETLMKNDALTDAPASIPFFVGIPPGFCEGEAAASVFDVSGIGAVVRVNKVSGPLFGASGAVARSPPAGSRRI